VVVAVVAVRVVQVAVDEVIGVVTVRDGGVAAVRPVDVLGVVRVARVVGRAGGGVLSVDLDLAAIDVVAVVRVQVAFVEVVDVVLVLHRGVSAVRTVNVIVTAVAVVLAHRDRR
jgi:hypothetical protein